MITVSEVKKANEVKYIVRIKENEGNCREAVVHYHCAEIKQNGKNYYLLYDKDMNPIENVFEYVNVSLANKSDNSRSKALYALKFLYCFEEIVGNDVADFNYSDFVDFMNFLRGQNSVGDSVIFENLTYRSAETVNGYFSVYRSFLEYQGKDNPHLFKRVSRYNENFSLVDNMYKPSTMYKSNARITAKEEIPMYISLEEFSEIIQLVRNEYTEREECMIRLMYEAGMRIGEVLGLTNEDVRMESIDGKYYAVVYIRNRITDKKYQKAKTCLGVTSKHQYKTIDYNTYKCGYQKVFISEDLYELIGDYIEVEHSAQRTKHPQNYYNNTMADSVMNEEENFYIFLNKLGKPISYKTWINIIRDIFYKLGIPLDSNVREHNVSHRFRHGFAMFHIQHMGIKSKELAELMRHTSISSVMKYYRPTTSDQIKIKTAFAEELYTMLPGLKRLGDNE